MIAAALIIGSSLFLITMSVVIDWENAHTRIPMLVMIAAISAIGMYAMSFAAFQFFIGQARIEQRNDVGISSAASALLTSTVLRYALIEGGVMLNGLVFLLEDSFVNLGVGIFGILIMFAVFPKKADIESKVSQMR